MPTHRNRSYQRCAVSDRHASCPELGAMTDAELLEPIKAEKAEKYPGYLVREKAKEAREEICRRFRLRNEIGPSLFKRDHWQTLFKIEYPGVL